MPYIKEDTLFSLNQKILTAEQNCERMKKALTAIMEKCLEGDFYKDYDESLSLISDARKALTIYKKDCEKENQNVSKRY